MRVTAHYTDKLRQYHWRKSGIGERCNPKHYTQFRTSKTKSVISIQQNVRRKNKLKWVQRTADMWNKLFSLKLTYSVRFMLVSAYMCIHLCMNVCAHAKYIHVWACVCTGAHLSMFLSYWPETSRWYNSWPATGIFADGCGKRHQWVTWPAQCAADPAHAEWTGWTAPPGIHLSAWSCLFAWNNAQKVVFFNLKQE